MSLIPFSESSRDGHEPLVQRFVLVHLLWQQAFGGLAAHPLWQELTLNQCPGLLGALP